MNIFCFMRALRKRPIVRGVVGWGWCVYFCICSSTWLVPTCGPVRPIPGPYLSYHTSLLTELSTFTNSSLQSLPLSLHYGDGMIVLCLSFPCVLIKRIRLPMHLLGSFG